MMNKFILFSVFNTTDWFVGINVNINFIDSVRRVVFLQAAFTGRLVKAELSASPHELTCFGTYPVFNLSKPLCNTPALPDIMLKIC